MLKNRKAATPATSTSTSTATERQRAAVTTLIRSLDAVGHTGLLADSRATLARAEATRRGFAEAHLALRERFEGITARVAAGDLSPADALQQLGAITSTAAKTDAAHGTLAQRLAAETVEAIESQAVDQARRDAARVHKTLAADAAQLVTVAVDAAGALFNVAEYVAAIQRAVAQPRWNGETGQLKGWPRFDPSTIEPVRRGTLWNLLDLNDRLRQVHDAARVLAVIDQTTVSALYRTPPARTDESYLVRWTPPELQLAVAAKLGWSPGLWRVTDTKPRPGEHGRRNRGSDDLRPDHAEQIVRDVTRGAVSGVTEQQAENRLITSR